MNKQPKGFWSETFPPPPRVNKSTESVLLPNPLRFTGQPEFLTLLAIRRIPCWEVYLGGLKDLMRPAVNLHLQWNYLQVLCFPPTRCISLMRQLFKVHRLSEGTGSSSNLQRVSLLYSTVLFTMRSVLWLPKLPSQSGKLFRLVRFAMLTVTHKRSRVGGFTY